MESDHRYFFHREVCCHYTTRRINLVDRRRLELRFTTCKAVVIPPILAAQILAGLRGALVPIMACRASVLRQRHRQCYFSYPTGPTLLIVRHLTFLIVSTHCEDRTEGTARFSSTILLTNILVFGGDGWIRTNARLREVLQTSGFSHSPTSPNLVDRRRIELLSMDCKTIVYPSITISPNFVTH